MTMIMIMIIVNGGAERLKSREVIHLDSSSQRARLPQPSYEGHLLAVERTTR